MLETLEAVERERERERERESLLEKVTLKIFENIKKNKIDY